MPKDSAATKWVIEEPIRWPVIVGIGFGVPALLTLSVAYQQHASYEFTIILFLSSICFFLWDWRKHKTPRVFLCDAVVAISPSEFREEEILSCDIRLPSTSGIKVRHWSVTAVLLEPVSNEEPAFESTVLSETTFAAMIGPRDIIGDQYLLHCRLITPRRPNLSSSEDIPLRAAFRFRVGLGIWGTWKCSVEPSSEKLI